MSEICVVRREYYPFCPHVQRNIGALEEEGHTIDAICLRRSGEKFHEVLDGRNVYRLLGGKRRSGKLHYVLEYAAVLVRAFVGLSYLAVRKRYHAVEVDTLPDAMVFATLVPKLLGAKIVLYLFECMPELFETTYEVPSTHWVVRILRWMESRASQFADHVLYCGPGYQAIQEPRAGKPLRSTVILNVPDETLFPPGEPTRLDWDTRERPFRILSHGSVLWKYGVQTLIQAVPTLRSEIPHLEVVVAGDGEYRGKLEELARTLGVEDTVTFAGFVPSTQMSELIAQSDVGVITILYDHLLPSKLFEYMVSRRPVVSSSIAFVKDFCQNGEALFYRTGDSEALARTVIQLHRDCESARAMVHRATELYEKCRWPEMRRRYVEVYANLAGPKSS